MKELKKRIAIALSMVLAFTAIAWAAPVNSMDAAAKTSYWIYSRCPFYFSEDEDYAIDSDFDQVAFEEGTEGVNIGDYLYAYVDTSKTSTYKPYLSMEAGVTYSSSDSSVISVDAKGNMSFLKEGVSLITVTWNGNSVYSNIFVVPKGTADKYKSTYTKIEPTAKKLVEGYGYKTSLTNDEVVAYAELYKEFEEVREWEYEGYEYDLYVDDSGNDDGNWDDDDWNDDDWDDDDWDDEDGNEDGNDDDNGDDDDWGYDGEDSVNVSLKGASIPYDYLVVSPITLRAGIVADVLNNFIHTLDPFSTHSSTCVYAKSVKGSGKTITITLNRKINVLDMVALNGYLGYDDEEGYAYCYAKLGKKFIPGHITATAGSNVLKVKLDKKLTKGKTYELCEYTEKKWYQKDWLHYKKRSKNKFKAK